MNNIWSYCGLVAARISASDKDLPVLETTRLTENDFDLILLLC